MDMNEIEFELDKVALGLRIRNRRKELGLSLDDLSYVTDRSVAHLNKIEIGAKGMSLDVLLPLAIALRMDLNTLLDFHPEEYMQDESIDYMLFQLPEPYQVYLKSMFLKAIKELPVQDN